MDKVFLLSESEAYTEAAKKYGFVSDNGAEDEARRAKSSLYAKALGTWSNASAGYVGNCWWWLRSPGIYSNCASYVYSNGWAGRGFSHVSVQNAGVRPALNLNLAASSAAGSPNLWSYAGTVCSDGTVEEKLPSEAVPFSNPRIEKDSSMEAGQKVTWDCVWFGSYPQAEVVPASKEYTALDKKLLQDGDLVRDDALYQKLQAATGWDEQGDIVISGKKYRRIKKADATMVVIGYSEYYQWENGSDYHYFKYQPIKWRVLSVNGTEAFLLADQALDDKQYHTVSEDVTWESSTIRSWLNGYGASANKQNEEYSGSNFINTAFSTYARTAIKDTKVENKDNLSCGTEGGKDTTDKVFLLSESEVYTDAAKKYGFVSDYGIESDEARRAKSSLYAKALGTWSNGRAGYVGNCWWWLRSPGINGSLYATYVNSYGWADGDYLVGNHNVGVRPALNLNLAASSDAGSSALWSYAGTVCSDGTENEVPYVEAKPDIAECEISLERTSYPYDGTAKEPKVTVKDGSSILENGKDYKLAYSDNIDAGTAAVHITGVGDYEGKVSKAYTIIAKAIKSAVVSLEKDSYPYDGTAKKPSVSVKDGTLTLKEGRDYAVSYSDNTSAGTAKVTVTGKGNYAGDIIKTFTITAQAGPVQPLKKFTWNRGNWNFNNNDAYFLAGRYINQINSTYLNRLKQNLNNSEYETIFNKKDGWIYDIWCGSCYGMSATNFLSVLDLMPYSDYKKNAENLYELDCPLKDNNIGSLITYYQMLQVKDVVQQQKRITKHQSHETNIKKMISLLNTNPTVRVSFQKKGWGGHAILAYGYEYGKYTWNGKSYDGCIKICDPNSSRRYRDDCNIYFNTATYDWTIPVYYSSGPITSQAGAVFCYVGADVNEINAGGYLGNSQTKESALEYVARIDINTNSDTKDYSVVKVEKSDGKYIEKDTDSDDIKASYSYIFSGGSKGTPGYDLFDSKSAYKVTQKDKKAMSLSIDYGECCLEGELSEGDSIIFDKDGCVEASGEDGKFEISMTFNGEHPTKWSTVQVSGTGSDEISVEKGDEGYIVSGENLHDVGVELEHREDSVRTNFSTEYDTACICELDKDTTGVKVDMDGNGTYETIIRKVSNGTAYEPVDYPNITSKPSQTASPAGTPTASPGKTPEVTPEVTPEITARPEVTPRPEVSAGPDSTPKADVQKKPAKSLKKGAMVSDRKTQAVYKITGTGKNRTVEYVSANKKNASRITIPAKVKLGGHYYKVTSIAKNALKNSKKLKYAVIGKNVKKIGKKAFYGCKKLQYLYVKSKKLTAKSIGNQAFGRGYKSPRVKSAKGVWRRYARILPARGLSGKALFIIHPVKLVI